MTRESNSVGVSSYCCCLTCSFSWPYDMHQGVMWRSQASWTLRMVHLCPSISRCCREMRVYLVLLTPVVLSRWRDCCGGFRVRLIFWLLFMVVYILCVENSLITSFLYLILFWTIILSCGWSGRWDLNRVCSVRRDLHL